MPVFGKTTIGGTLSSRAFETKVGVRFLASNNVTVNHIRAYAGSTGAARRLFVGIYNDNAGSPHNRLIYTPTSINSPTAGNPAWVDFPLSASITLIAGNYYWLAIKGTTGGWTIYSDPGSVNQVLTNADAGSIAPVSDPFGAGTTENNVYSIFAYSTVESSQTLLSNAYVLPYSIANPSVFEFAPSSTDIARRDYREPKLRQLCNHVLASGTFTLATCPRCLSKGYYYDILINQDGLIAQVQGVSKLGQELEKITITQVGENTFHISYGTVVNEVFGELTVPGREALLRQSIINAIYRLKTLQQLELENGGQFPSAELIDRIDKIDFFTTGDPRQIGYRVYVITVSGTATITEGTIIIV